jgi:glycosyltransferase involved in cell wall biosynthesis
VLHFSDTLLGRTETFVQSRLFDSHAEAFRSVAATWRHVQDGLPIPCPFLVLDRHEPVGQNRGLARLVTGPRRVAARNWEILRLILAARPDVVHAHFGTVGATVAPFCAALGIPLVVSFYGVDLSLPAKDARLARAYARMFRWAAALTAEGPVLARRLVDLGAPRAHVRLLPLALPQWALAAPPARAPRHPGRLRLLQVARFVEKKGVDLSIAALAAARAQGVDVQLTLAGGGPLEPELRQQASALGLEGDALCFIGYVSHDDLPPLLAQSDVLIQPSRTAASGDTEGGYPTILVEAMAQGVPVVGTRHADIPFVVRHGVTGLLSAENDLDGLTENLLRLAATPGLHDNLAKQTRGSVARRHDPTTLLRLKERIYREAMRRPRPMVRDAWRALPLPDPFSSTALGGAR